MAQKSQNKPVILIALGTRPEVIRFAPIIKLLKSDKSVEVKVVHTGQHYSETMSKVFFDELGLPYPDYNFMAGGMTPAEQLSKISLEFSTIVCELHPKLVCVWGDTNSSLYIGLVANKLGLKLAHIEAGCRSYDFRMAEEYNRIMLDTLADYTFPVSSHDKENLIKEHSHGKVLNCGDPLYDLFISNMKAIPTQTPKEKYSILTLHRAENVDNPDILKEILTKIDSFCSHNIIFPIHPRTKHVIDSNPRIAHLLDSKYKIIEPVGYKELLTMLKGCDYVITDSGGFQKEAFFAKKVCVTMRKSTEWLDTVKLGVNILVDPVKKCSPLSIKTAIKEAKQKLLHLKEKPYGSGHASEKIVKRLVAIVND